MRPPSAMPCRPPDHPYARSRPTCAVLPIAVSCCRSSACRLRCCAHRRESSDLTSLPIGCSANSTRSSRIPPSRYYPDSATSPPKTNRTASPARSSPQRNTGAHIRYVPRAVPRGGCAAHGSGRRLSWLRGGDGGARLRRSAISQRIGRSARGCRAEQRRPTRFCRRARGSRPSERQAHRRRAGRDRGS